jgi:hypothetical protein
MHYNAGTMKGTNMEYRIYEIAPGRVEIIGTRRDGTRVSIGFCASVREAEANLALILG